VLLFTYLPKSVVWTDIIINYFFNNQINLSNGIFIIESKTFISYSSKYLTAKIQSRYAPENTDPFRPRYIRKPTLPEGEKPRM